MTLSGGGGRGYITYSSSTRNFESISVMRVHKHTSSKLHTKYQVYQINIEGAMVPTLSRKNSEFQEVTDIQISTKNGPI